MDGKEIVFYVSGMLWKASLIMADQETGSLWSQLLGECMEGPLRGRKLITIPSVITSWGTWKREYPQTDAMVWPQHRNTQYNTAFFDGKLNQFVVGVVDGKASRAYQLDHLLEQPLINDQFAGRQQVVWFDRESRGTWIHNRQLDDQLLEFEQRDDMVFDRQTGSRWNLITGLAVAGPLKGSKLQPLLAIPSFRQAWNIFFKDSEYSHMGP
jgi:hypothetical protein